MQRRKDWKESEERNGEIKKGKEWLERVHAPTNLLALEKFLGRFVTNTFKLDQISNRKLAIKDKL